MCGIVGYVGKRSAQDVLLDGLEKLEYRGYDSAGVALALDGGIRVVKAKGRLTALRERLAAQQLAQSFCGIGHTRWATHGEPSDVNSHPHSTPRVSIVHNGIIENYGLLKERLIAKGYTFQSETDTEVLVKLIDSCYTGDPLRALQQALAKVRGSYALAVLFRDYPDTVFAVKRESPLIVGWGEGENFVASDIPALLKYTRKYSVLEEGDMAVCTAEGIRFYNEFGEPVEREVLTADWDMEAAEKGGYPHFMLKEINEQPTAITATVSPRVEDGMPDLRIPQLTDEVLRSIGTVHLVGCGTAMHAGMVGKSAIETLAREKGCAVEYTELYDSFAIGGARFVALSPAPVSDPNGEYAAFDGAAGDSANDLSAVFYLEYEGTRFLLTGDASSAVEKNVMRRYEAGLYAAFGVNLEEIDVLKVSHHGSDAATSAEFLSLLAPDCAVISVGAANAYGHPAEDTLGRLYRSGAAIYRTDFFGTVRCRVRAGKSLEITSQATENV